MKPSSVSQSRGLSLWILFWFVAYWISPAESPAQWRQATGLDNSATIKAFVSSYSYVFAASSAGVLRSANGTGWQAVNAGLLNTTVNAIDFVSPYVFAGTQNGVFRSANSGLTWDSASIGLGSRTVRAMTHMGNVLLAATSGGLYSSSDNGTSWTIVGAGLTSPEVLCFVQKYPDLLAGTVAARMHYPGGVYRSTNTGLDWSQAGLSGLTVFALATRGTDLFAGVGGGINPYNSGIELTTDNGSTWNVVNTGIPGGAIVQAFAVSGQLMFAGTASPGGRGVYLSQSLGRTWDSVNTGLTTATIKALQIYGSNLVAGTSSTGIWWRPLEEIVPSITVQEPTAGVRWAVGGRVTVRWSSRNLKGTVRIKLSTNNGSNWITLVDSLENGGRWQFDAPSTPSSLCVIRVESDALSTIYGTSPSTFYIESCPGFVMDGVIDGGVPTLATNDGLHLYGKINGNLLYLATESATSQSADMFIFVSAARGALRDAPWKQVGKVASPAFYLGNESSNGWRGWFDATDQGLGSHIWSASNAAVLEGALRLDSLFHTIPAAVYATIGKYGTLDNGTLIAQVPLGNGDGNIDPGELYPVRFAGTVSSPAAGATWNAKSTQSVLWDPAPFSGTVSIQLSTDGGATYAAPLVTNSANDGSQAVTVPDIRSTTCRIKVESYQFPVDFLTNPGNFTIAQGAPPAPILSSPANGVQGVGGSPTLVWNASAGATSYRLQLSTNSNFGTISYDSTAIANTSHKVEWLSGATTYYWRVFAVNPDGTSDPSAAWRFTTLTGPYLGTRFSIPGTVEVEFYDAGGEGVTYHDSTAANKGAEEGTRFRTAEGVDVEACQDPAGGGFDIGWTARGEWTSYAVNIPEAGSYRVDARVASRVPFRFHLELDGTALSSILGNSGTGGWQDWITLRDTVTLPSGDHVLYLVMDDPGAGGDDGNYNRLQFTSITLAPPEAPRNLTATAVSPSQINLAWTDASTNEDGFLIERAPGGTTSYSHIDAVDSNSTSYADTGLTPSTSYAYRVFASNSAGSSDYSNTATMTTRDTIIVALPVAGAVWEGGKQDTVSWTSSNSAGEVAILLSIDGGVAFPTTLKTTPASAGSVTVDVPQAPSTTCRVKVQSVSDTAVYGLNPGNFAIQPESSPPQIAEPIVSGGGVGQPIDVSAEITDDLSVASAVLHYRVAGAAIFTPLAMSASGTTCRGTIPASAVTWNGVDYFVRALDPAGNVGRYPATGWAHVKVVVSGEGLVNSLSQPGGSEQSAYRLVSVPFEVDNSSPHSVLVDDLGAYDPTKWRFFDLTVEQTYSEYPNVSAMTPGRAFWLIVKEAGKVIDSGPGKSVSTAVPYSINLHPLWNLVGNPYSFQIPVGELSWNLGDAITLHAYEGAWINPVTNPVAVLEPFKGYALHASSATTLRFSGDLSTGPLPKQAFSRELSTWWVGIEAHCGEAGDVDNVAMVAEGANRAQDSLDILEPPVIGEYVSVSFPHPEWGDRAGKYCVDARPESRDGELWEFEVHAVRRDPVTLSFAGLEKVPQSKEVWLLDNVVHVRQDLRQNPRYRIASPGEGHGRSFALVVGEKAEVDRLLAAKGAIPTSFVLLPNFPNPFNPRTTIPFGIPATCRLRLTVYTVLGEEVTVLVDGTVEAGYHTVEFDGTTHASSIYFVRLQAEGAAPMIRTIMLIK